MLSASCVRLLFHLSSIVGLLGQCAFFYHLWWLDDVLTEDVSLNEIGKPHLRLIRDELLRWDREDLYGRRQHEKQKRLGGISTYGRFLPG